MADSHGATRLAAERRVSSEHSEALQDCQLKRGAHVRACTYTRHHRHLLVAAAKRLHVIYSDPPILLQQSAVQAAIRHLWNPPERAVLGGLEVDGGSPIVAEVLGHLARGALRVFGRIEVGRVHLGILQLATVSARIGEQVGIKP